MSGIPGPAGAEALRWLQGMRTDVLQTLPALRRRYGDVASIPAPGRWEMVLVAHPDGVQHVLQRAHTRYRKAPTYDVLRMLLGEGLLTSEGDAWRLHRRLAQPAFHGREVARLATMMVAETEAMVDGWRPGQEIDVAAEMRDLTLRIVGRALFSDDLADDAARIAAALDEVLAYAQERFRSPLGPFVTLPTPGLYRFRRAADVLDEVVSGIIERHRRTGGGDDLLSMLMAAEDDDTGRRLTDRELKDEILTFVLAGHETTAHALAWTLWLLGRHAAPRRRLEDEVDALQRPPGGGDLDDLPYTGAVVEEGMRLYPPAWVVERSPVEDDEIGGYTIREGAIVMVSQWVTHRHPDVWDAPLAFDPVRFLDGRAERRHRFAHIPFGAGPRQCIGAGFAGTEARLVLATVARRVRLDPVPGYPVEPEPAVTLRPRRGIRMTVAGR